MNGLQQLQRMAGFAAPLVLVSIEPEASRLVAIVRDASGNTRRVALRHADQIELAGLANHDRQEVAAVLAEHHQSKGSATQ